MPQRRWIDPDTLKPRSNGWERKKLDRVWTDPVQRAYIKGFGPVQFIFSHCFSFFTHRSLVFSDANPNPSSSKSAQNPLK